MDVTRKALRKQTGMNSKPIKSISCCGGDLSVAAEREQVIETILDFAKRWTF